MRRRRKPEAEEHENHERWLVSYADMVTLLAALFIMLFAISTIDVEKWKELASSLSGSFSGSTQAVVTGGADGSSVVGHGEDSLIPGLSTRPAGAEPADDVALEELRTARRAEAEVLDAAQHQLERDLAAAGLSDRVAVRIDDRGLVVSIVTDDLLFPSGSAELRPEGRALLAELVAPLHQLTNPISVEGHTDPRPISGRYPSNWELSTARAGSVLRELVDEHGFPSSRLAAAGYADQRPVAPNDDEVGRAANRRVEIVVLSQWRSAGVDDG